MDQQSDDKIKEYSETNVPSAEHSLGRIPERLVVSCFGYIGCYLLYIFYLARFIPISISSSLAPLVFAVAYLPVTYLLWRRIKPAALMTFGAMMSFYALAIMFVFTFPIWVIFGPICLVYAFLTGLFKKQVQASDLKNNISIPPVSGDRQNRIPKKIKPLIGLAVLFVVFYGIYYGAYYGFRFPPCVYTDEEASIPEDLQNADILLEENVYLARGNDPDNCSPMLKSIKNEIVDTETIGNITVGEKYFTERGLTVEPLTSGKTFKLIKIVAVTKHGLSTIDSGSGPLYYLVLKDEQGIIYQIHTASLGSDEDEAFLSFSNNGVRQGMLSWEYFVDYREQKIADATASISYELDNLADTTGWKTFTNIEKSYQIKYPSDWIVKPESESKGYGSDRFLGPNDTTISVIGYEKSLRSSDAQHRISVTVAGMPAIEGLITNHFGEPTEFITFEVAITEPINGLYYQFSFTERDGDNVYAYLSVFNAMINTFVVQSQNIEEELNKLVLDYSKKGDFIKMAETLEKLVTINPNKAQYHASLAVAYAKIGKIDEAVKEAREAVRLDKNFEAEAKAFVQSLGRTW